MSDELDAKASKLVDSVKTCTVNQYACESAMLILECLQEIERLEGVNEGLKDSLLYVNLKPCPQCEMSEVEVTRLKAEYLTAAELVATLYETVTGNKGGPKRGVVEDVIDVISSLSATIAKLNQQLSGKTFDDMEYRRGMEAAAVIADAWTMEYVDEDHAPRTCGDIIRKAAAA
jgi:hypothetical protein